MGSPELGIRLKQQLVLHLFVLAHTPEYSTRDDPSSGTRTMALTSTGLAPPRQTSVNNDLVRRLSPCEAAIPIVLVVVRTGRKQSMYS